MGDVPNDFVDFYRAVWGYDPHLWQSELAERVLSERRWPDVIDLPTGAGKTSTLDIAVYALSALPDVFPRRIAFVVDRRLIVDQTVEHAAKLADRLRSAQGDLSEPSALRRVAERLAGLSSTGEPLDVGRLRGGHSSRNADASEWLRWPDQPAVVVSTVDQFGSRLLFRGYGVGKGMWPIHAGLTGNDCLVLLDEVHISAPLAETLTDLYGVFAPVRNLPRRWHCVQMSATPIGTPASRFVLEERHVVPDSKLAAVVDAVKSARLVEAGKPKQSQADAWAASIRALVDELGVTAGVVGVVVNRVASARLVAEALEPLGEVLLLTGRMRPWERRDREDRARRLADPDRTTDEQSCQFVVATQCIEVGADLSFDGLITEASSLSSLRQRFGRLDRRGHKAAAETPAPALIVGLAPTLAQESDPVYGTALRVTWDVLRARFGDRPFDVGARSDDLTGLPAGVDLPERPAAVLMPAHLDMLAMTNPAPACSPDVAPFLRGFEHSEADVAIVWRGDVTCTNRIDELTIGRTLFALLPPDAMEAVAVPRSAAMRWLNGSPPVDVADVDGAVSEADPDEAVPGRRAWRWTPGAEPELITADQLAPGDTIVVPCSYGGLSNGVWSPDSIDDVPDVAGPVSAEVGRRVVRVAVDLPGVAPPAAADDEPLAVFKDDLAAGIESAVDGGAGWLHDLDPDGVDDVGTDEFPVWVVVDQPSVTIETFDGTDEANTMIGRKVTLSSHLAGVGTFAAEFAEHTFLAPELVGDLRLAGELHDLGKADSRFQVMLHGDEIAALAAAEPLAKSTHRRRRFRGGYPVGMRHEFASAELVASARELLERAHDADLVMHLVTTHHGFGRALPNVVDDPAPETIEIDSHGYRLAARSTLDAGIVGVESVERFALAD